MDEEGARWSAVANQTERQPSAVLAAFFLVERHQVFKSSFVLAPALCHKDHTARITVADDGPGGNAARRSAGDFAKPP
jgi:hypothetical protein